VILFILWWNLQEGYEHNARIYRSVTDSLVSKISLHYYIYCFLFTNEEITSDKDLASFLGRTNGRTQMKGKEYGFHPKFELQSSFSHRYIFFTSLDSVFLNS